MNETGAQEKRLGGIESPRDPRDFNLGRIQAPVKIPATYLPNISPFPIWYQGQQPSCGGHAGAWLKMFLDWKESGEARDYSPRFVYAKAKEMDGLPDLEGTYARAVFKVLLNSGVCDNTFFPNDSLLPKEEYADAKRISADAYDNANPHVIKAYASVSDLSLEGLKQAIYQNGVVLVLKKPYFRNGTDGHFIVLNGYDETRLRYANSFGRDWGENGYGWFTADDVPDIIEAWTAVDVPDWTITVMKQEVSLLRRLAEIYIRLLAALKGRQTGSSTMRPFYISATGAGLSATVAGFSVVGVAEIVARLLDFVGFPVDQSLVSEIIYQVVTVAGALYALFGLARKAYRSAAGISA